MTPPITQKKVFEKLPQMAVLLDEARAGEIFERRMIAAAGCKVRQCRIDHVKLRPEKNCLVTYNLDLIEQTTGVVTELTLNLLAYPSGESANQFAKARQRTTVRTPIGEGLFHLPELESVVRVFPNDRKLSGLPALADVHRLKSKILPEVVRKSFGDEWAIGELTIEPVHYAAERSYTVRADLELINQSKGESERRTIFGKTYCEGEAAVVWRLTRELWQNEACQRGQLLIPQPLAFQPEIETIWQSGLAGKTLNEVDPESAELPALMESAARSVAALHRASIQSAQQVNQSDLIGKLEDAKKLIGRVRPSMQSKLNSLVGRLVASSGNPGERPVVTLHGDLHLKNFFATGNRVALIDLDNLALGDPLRDVGSFIAALHYRELLDGKSCRVNISNFVRAYRDGVNWEVADFALDWHTAAALVYERAYRCITRLKNGRMAIIDDLVDLADQLF
ncbi:MAG: phosphotransferase family protein [Blastocatellales bacterium]